MKTKLIMNSRLQSKQRRWSSLLTLLFGWIIPLYLYIGTFTLLYAIWKDRNLKGFTWKNVLGVTLLWPVVWCLMLLLKYGK
ncbi:hypothetical protein DFQ00_102237 [Paenibacillus barcinonensis]|uniref:Uncharacterized protein n=1 Tax=Paenibacillus barcinonensis TaxID=198119 RepID=A0A2V4W812_PAEBA|nr:hypothetical protein DFQ00_102237 [Paenibacillus barcinonensis]